MFLINQYRKIILIHISIWIIYILYEISILWYISPQQLNIYETFFAFILNAGVFYFNTWFILSSSFKKKSRFLIILAIAVLLTAYLCSSFLITKYIYPFFNESKLNIDDLQITKLFIAQRIWRGSYFIILSFGYCFAKKSVLAEKKTRQLERDEFLSQLNEKELKNRIAVKELELIKSKINPHFLHNTLNFFYSNIYPLSKPLAQSVLLLSNLMRYTFESSNTDGKVSLSEELQYIQDFILLNQLRFSNTLFINFRVNGKPLNNRISSFLLIPLVENAFKYGELEDREHPIEIVTTIIQNQLNFKIKNKKGSAKLLFEKTGTGIRSLKDHLDMVYPGNYDLSISDDSFGYQCDLMIYL